MRGRLTPILNRADEVAGHSLGIGGLNAIGSGPPPCFIRYRPINPTNGG